MVAQLVFDSADLSARMLAHSMVAKWEYSLVRQLAYSTVDLMAKLTAVQKAHLLAGHWVDLKDSLKEPCLVETKVAAMVSSLAAMKAV